MTHLPSLQPVVDAARDEHLNNARSYLALLPRDMYHALLTQRYCYSHCCHCDTPCAPAAAYPTYIRYTMLVSDMPTDAASFARLMATPGRYCTAVQCLGCAHDCGMPGCYAHWVYKDHMDHKPEDLPCPIDDLDNTIALVWVPPGQYPLGQMLCPDCCLRRHGRVARAPLAPADQTAPAVDAGGAGGASPPGAQ
jgi:hypothetical protein